MYGNCNAPRAITFSAIIYCLRCMVKHSIPLNQVTMSCIAYLQTCSRQWQSVLLVNLQVNTCNLKSSRGPQWRNIVLPDAYPFCINSFEEGKNTFALSALKHEQIYGKLKMQLYVQSRNIFISFFVSLSGLFGASKGGNPPRKCARPDRHRGGCWWECVDQSTSRRRGIESLWSMRCLAGELCVLQGITCLAYKPLKYALPRRWAMYLTRHHLFSLLEAVPTPRKKRERVFLPLRFSSEGKGVG